MAALDALKNALVSPPVLALLTITGKMALETDACAVQTGCVLLQKQSDNNVRTIGHWFRALNDADRRYDTTKKECRAVVWSVLILRPYLEGTRFTIRADHDLLK